MQKINNIEIKNFKSIRQTEIKDCRKVNIFIGYPNVGKSNILEALALYGVNDETKFKDLIRVKENTTIFHNGFIENDFSVILNECVAVVGSYQHQQLALQFQVLSSKIENNLQYDSNVVNDSSEAVRKELQFNNFDLTKTLWGNKSLNSIESFIIKKYDFVKNVNKTNSGYLSLIYPNGSNIFNVLFSNKKLNDDSLELFKQYDLELLFDNRDQEFAILKRTGSRIFTVPYELVADTLQRLIFYKAAILSNKERILLFEEPEAHMFSPYISKFTSDIIHDENNNQYFIATHSPFVLNDFMEDLDKEDLSIYAVGLNDGETVVHRLTNEEIDEVYQYGIDLFFNLENYLKNVV